MNPMMHGALMALVFAVFGFFLAFLAKRVAGLIIIGIFVYASLKVLGYLGAATDLRLLGDTASIVAQSGKTLVHLVRAMLHAATPVCVAFFLGGGLCGLFMRR